MCNRCKKNFNRTFVRFPIPDLRPIGTVDRFPWWMKRVYDEKLQLSLSKSVLRTCLKDFFTVKGAIRLTASSIVGSFAENVDVEPIKFLWGERNAAGELCQYAIMSLSTINIRKFLCDAIFLQIGH